MAAARSPRRRSRIVQAYARVACGSRPAGWGAETCIAHAAGILDGCARIPRPSRARPEPGRPNGPLSRACRGGWLVNPRRARGDPSMRKQACRPAGHGEHARLSAGAGGLLGRRDDVGRREEPPRYESGFRAHGSNQRFHRLLRHAVARALTTAPSLVGVGPAAPKILTPQGWRRKRRPGRCPVNPPSLRPRSGKGRLSRCRAGVWTAGL